MISTGPPKQQTKELILSGWGDTPHRWLFRDVFCVPKLPGQLSEPLKWNPMVSSIFFRYFGEIFWTKKLNLLRGLLHVTNSGVDIALKSLGCFSLNLKLRKPPCLLDPKNSMAAHSKTASNWASFTMSCAFQKRTRGESKQKRSFQCELEKNQFHNKFGSINNMSLETNQALILLYTCCLGVG